MTNKKLHELMLKCKPGARVNAIPIDSERLSLMWWYDSDHHTEVITKKEVNAMGTVLFNTLQRATEAMK